MLALTLALVALAAPAVLDVIVYSNGQVNHITEDDVDPDDDIFIRGLSSTSATTVRFLQSTIVNSVTAEAFGVARIQGVTRILGPLVVESDGFAQLDQRSVVFGPTHVLGGGELRMNAQARAGDITVAKLGLANLGGLIHGHVSALGEVMILGTVNGSVTLSAGPTAPESLASDARLDRPIALFRFARIRSFDSDFRGGVQLNDSAQFSLNRASTFGSVVDVKDSATLRVKAVAASVPFGAVTASFGVITGRDSQGNLFSVEFTREPGATVIVEQQVVYFGSYVCDQGVTNSTGLYGRLLVTGSQGAADDFLTLHVDTLPPSTISYCLVGDQAVTVLLPHGRVCTGGNIGRYVGPGQIFDTGTNGSYSFDAPIQPLPGNPATFVASGETYTFQCWFRDSGAAGPVSRFTNARAVTFL